MKLVNIFILAAAITFLISCNTVDPPDKSVLTLTLEDVSCTEAWITLTTNNLQLPATLNLLKDNTITKTINLQTADTLLYIDSLLPNQTYKFHSVIQSINHSSNEISVTTFDTTSHDFTLQTITFGEHGNSVLFDVAIVGDEIWAVGQIYMKDSLGNPDNNAYNAVHWDGSGWELKRISVNYNGNIITPPLFGVFAFSNNEIWLSSGVPIKGDGNNWTQYHLFDMGVLNQSDGYLTKIWGSSSSDLYYSGTLGTIAHWNGSNWTKIESGTNVNLRDISGQGEDIFITGYSLDYSKSALLRLENNNVEVIWENSSLSGTPPYGSLVFANKVLNNNLFVASSNGVYQDKLKIKHPRKQLFYSSGAINRIAGTGVNDLFTVGDWSNVWHYNGLNSRLIHSEQNTTSRFHSAAAKDNIFTAVGMRVENVIYHKATILIGRR